MKTNKFLMVLMLAGTFSFLTSCESNEKIEPQQDILPARFSVDIPSSISSQAGGRIGGRTADDAISGDDVYKNLNTFIFVGEAASKLVEEFVNGIRKYKIYRVQSLTYTGDDLRTKNLVVESNVTFEGVTWNYQLTISDAESAGEPDGGKALQIFWNNNSALNGIAIIKPYNCDRIKEKDNKNSIFRINYTELGSQYDAQMEVLASGLTLADPAKDQFSIGSLRMFAGKKNDVVDVYGNSNHPNAILFSLDGKKGINYAFVASGNEVADIGVAEVGLPSSSLNSTDRNVLLKDNSVKTVFTKWINSFLPGIDPTTVNNYLKNTAAPGYFAKKGFIAGGVSPGSAWDTLAG
ncbi:MAG: hypothetical protein K2U26_12130, partial [Cyclobacteriaceae bacterium]|nr:hypothetical protein [Cyclobacteriaceae bacterium]